MKAMKKVVVMTQSAFKFQEISEMLALYGCQARREDWEGEGDPIERARERAPDADAVAWEQTSLREMEGGRVEHESRLAVFYPQSGETKQWVERVRGSLAPTNESPQDPPDAYGWDARFTPAGSALTLHELKQRGLKVSARQLAVGAWCESWLHYQTPVSWRHMEPAEGVEAWLSDQPILQTEQTAATRELIQSVARGGAWFKASGNRRVKHYWWPGLNAGIPMTPKKDYVHELTFLTHDLIHWAMPDVIPSSGSERDYRLYVVTRMMSEAITLVMADMVFIDQALKAGLVYDTLKRAIHPLYDARVSAKAWCKAMSHYAIRGDARELGAIAKSPEALVAFKAKYSRFFEADLRWTAHNARHLQKSVDPRWIALHERFKSQCDLGLSSTEDYHQAWSEDDKLLVDQVFERLWSLRWVKPSELYQGGVGASGRRLQRWWLGQLALTYKMEDVPLSGCVRQSLVRACLESPTEEGLREPLALWESYVDALGGLARVSSNDTSIFKAYYPIVPPLYLSYDLEPGAYRGVAAMWSAARSQSASVDK